MSDMAYISNSDKLYLCKLITNNGSLSRKLQVIKQRKWHVNNPENFFIFVYAIVLSIYKMSALVSSIIVSRPNAKIIFSAPITRLFLS